VVTLTPVPGATHFTVTAAPIDGGSPSVIACSTPACTISGLSPGTSYFITATATTPSGTSPSSPLETITTPPAGYVEQVASRYICCAITRTPPMEPAEH
jgi:hypothetical protein